MTSERIEILAASTPSAAVDVIEVVQLTGERGPTGLTGPQGVQGDIGAAGPPGAAGAPGANGVAGAAGPPGQAGVDGRTIWSGLAPPSNVLGVNGDFFINTASSDLYGPKIAGAWPPPISLIGGIGPAGAAGAVGGVGPAGAAGAAGAVGGVGPAGPAGAAGAAGAVGGVGPAGPAGAAGAAGVNGLTVRSGAGAPAGALGVNGDWYIATDLHMIYGPKSGGAWPTPVEIAGISQLTTNGDLLTRTAGVLARITRAQLAVDAGFIAALVADATFKAAQDSRYMSVTRHGGKWRRAAVLSIPLSTVFTVTMDTEDSDTDGYGTATSTTFTIPAGLGGIHAITATVAWAGTPTGNNFIRLTIGGITYDMSGNTISQSIGGTITVPLNAADTIVMQVWQTSAGAMNATAMLMINRIAA